MRRSPFALSLQLILCAFLALALTACGDNDDDDDGRVRQQRSGVFIDSAVDGLIYSSASRGGSTGSNGTPGGFVFLDGETVSFRLSCLLLGSAPGRDVVTPRTLANETAAINIARLLLTLDADGNNANGIDVGYVNLPNELCSADFDPFPETQFEAFVEQLRANNQLQRNQDPTAYGTPPNADEDIVTPEYAKAHLDCSEQGLVFANGSCGNVAALSIGDVTQNEGTGGTTDFVFTITRSGSTSGAASVTVNTEDGSATSPADYAALVNETVNFVDGQASRTVTVSVVADAAPEGNETFFVNLSNAVGAIIVGDAGLGTILNDDAQAGQSLFSINDVSMAEGDSGTTTTFSFIVSRTGDTTIEASVTAQTADGTATDADNDYEPAGPDEIVFGANETSKTFDVTVNGDDVVEADQTFFVNLSNPVNGGFNSPADQQGLGTIENDDGDPADPRASIADASVTEGAAGTTTQIIFTVTLSEAAGADGVTVEYQTEDGTAVSTGPAPDYQGVSGTLTILEGDASGTISIEVNGDAFQENDEQFFVRLTGVTNATLDDFIATGTILNDDTITLLLAGAAKRSVTPTDAQIIGQSESYLGGTRIQRFHLGGFGFGPFKFVPSLGGATPEINFDQVSNAPAEARCFSPTLTGPTTADAPQPAICEDDTWVRVMVLQEPDGDRVAFVILDAVGAGNLIQDAVKARINAVSCEENACIEPENILFGQTHSHAGADLQGLWGGVPREWIDLALVNGAGAAARDAIRGSKPADLVMARGYTAEFNDYRRPRYRRNDLAPEEVDLAMTLLQARAHDGSGTLGTIMTYAAHPTSIGTDDHCLERNADGDCTNTVRVPHPDYPLGAEEDLEDEFGGTALYFNGPIADASASGGPGDPIAYRSVKKRGAAMAATARAFLEDNEVPLDPVIEARSVEVTLPITNPLFLAVGLGGVFNGYYQFTQVPFSDIPGFDQIPADLVSQFQDVQNQLPQPTPIARTLVSRVSLGTPDAGDPEKNRLEIVTLPGEATNSFGQYIRRLANESPVTDAQPKIHTMLLGLTHNSFGYIIPEEEFSYVDPSGEAGFTLPFTGYEEFVSLGPLTAPLLRIQGYNILFDAAPEQNIPPWITDCQIALDHGACIVGIVQDRIVQIAAGPAALFEAMADGCRDLGGPDELCDIFDTLADAVGGGGGVPGVPGGGDAELLPEAAKALLQGCDMLDTAHCLYPFPSDHFTVAAPAGSPQSTAEDRYGNKGTGRRVNFNIVGMPRNVAGKPIDPSEWNRNDGFSPGAMIITLVPALAANEDGSIPGAPPLTDIGQSLEEDSPVLVIDATALAEDDYDFDPQAHLHPVWAEIDLNAGFLLPSEGIENPNPLTPKRAALIVRPARNFAEGHRYVVVLRNLSDGASLIPAGAAFAACRDKLLTALPPLATRCAALDAEGGVFDVAHEAGVERNETLYLAWDFTVASAKNQTSRMAHMRDDAFLNVLGDEEDADGNIVAYGSAPAFTVTEVIENPNAELARVVKGNFTIPSYVVPADPSPLDGQNQIRDALRQLAEQVPAEFNDILDQCDDVDPTGLICDFLNPNEAIDLASSGSLPPNRLYYNPLDGLNPNDPEGLRYGDGLPDRNPLGSMTATFTCNIPKSAATAPGLGNARPSLYGHGLLGSATEVGAGNVRTMGNDHNMMFCATDWFGFATGDVPNVATVLIDISNFPVVPDAGQQGVLNQLFLARLMAHPEGFITDEAFKVGGQPVFDRREVFYDGNSQGGILGGPVIAASKDVNRGVLGVVGMNYSTLLRRSVDFDVYSIPLYLAYQDDLDRNLGFALIQMLWDRSENNGYAHHLTDGSALGGPDNQVLLHPAFADHQVSHWTAQVMARTVGVDVADLYPRKPGECGGDVQFCFADKIEFFEGSATRAKRDPDIAYFWDLPLIGRTGGGDYDSPGCPLPMLNCRTQKSAFIEFDEGKTAIPPTGNVPPRADDFDPHGFPRASRFGQCQKSHFLHTQGRVINVRGMTLGEDLVTGPENCPALPDPAGDPLPGGAGGPGDVCVGPLCLSNIPVLGGLLAGLLITADDTFDTVAETCHGTAGPLEPACAATDLLADLVINDGAGAGGPVGGIENASCADPETLVGGRSYQVVLPSESGQVISFQVLEPTSFDCANVADGAHPLILQGHGFGGSRTTSGFDNYRDAGYTVISIDQRGFGQSTGTVRTMDPDFEGRDLVQILDWAEENLDYLAYRNEPDLPAALNPNLLVGAIGGSYGGGYQFTLHNVDEKNRLDALAPDITWHDLRYSLNPGDTLKSAFGLLLSVGGTQGSYTPALQNQEVPVSRGLDPYILETLARAVATGEFPRESLDWFHYHSPSYWCGLNTEPQMPYSAAQYAVDPNSMIGSALGDVPGSNTRSGQPGVDLLISQGFRDNLFNFNEAWWNYQCARVRDPDADVRLITHQSGHILNLGGLTGQDLPPGTPLDVQTPGESGNCGNGTGDVSIDRGTATLQWFEHRLRGEDAPALDGTEGALCLSLSDDDAILIPEENVLAPRATAAGFPAAAAGTAYFQIDGVGASSVPQGLLALTLHNAGQLSPSVVPLLQVGDANGLIVAGIPLADISLRTPAGVQDLACEAGANVPSLRTGCDAIVYLGLGVKRGGSAEWLLIDDQVTPVRGLGSHSIELVGVGERLAQGDELALLIYGYHPQYIASYSRDPSMPVVNVEVDLQLPLYGVAAAGAPDFTPGLAAASVNGIATGTGCTDPSFTGANPECIATGSGANVVRQLCDYQWLPGVCEMFAQPDPGYQPGGAAQAQGGGFAASVAGYDDSPGKGELQLMVGAVHEHSGYSDGDPTAIPRDYFRAGRTGVNEPGKGVKLDFMFSSEHSDNEKLPVTTSAACIPFSQDFAEDPASLLEADPTRLAAFLDCNHLQDSHHHFKWLATLEQAMAETERNGNGDYTGFTAIRGFEWTNDYYNHLNVYFSTNVVNVKLDGSMLSMDFFWNWLRRPVSEGGGADALVSFNHPGGDPSLSPFDGGMPHNELLAQTRGGSNWNDMAYVPDADRNVVGIEVNGGDDIEWYIKALDKGWHIGPVAAEDEHGRNWSSHDQDKTLILARGRTPQDYYYAFQNRRTVSLQDSIIGRGADGRATYPAVHFWADGASVQEGTPLGSQISAPGAHVLHVDIDDVADGTRVALVSNASGGQAAPIFLGAAIGGAFMGTRGVTTPAAGEDWYFVVACPPDADNLPACGSDQNYQIVTAPIWFGQPAAVAAFDLCAPGGTPCLSDIPVVGPLLLTLLQEADYTLNTLAQTCNDNLGGTEAGALCTVSDMLAAAIIDTPPDGEPPPVADNNASCADDRHVGEDSRGASYHMTLTGHDGETVSFQVLEPTGDEGIRCAGDAGVAGAHPLMLHGPGYSGSRSTSGFDNYRERGYTVISVDPRGFGDTTGTVRVMDPEFEGQYLVQILDWAEQNLDYLSWRDEATDSFIPRPMNATSVPNGPNLVVGAQGGSYGGGYQLLILTVDAKKRLDAIQPDITWHDLRNSLNPGDVVKTLWDVALASLGEAVGHSSGGQPLEDGQDPFIKETLARGAATNEWPRQSLDWFHYRGLGYWCAAAGLPAMPYPAYGADAVPMLDVTGSYNVPGRNGDRPGFGDFLEPPGLMVDEHFVGLDVLLTQGMPDTLFNFNESWWNTQCLMAAGANVSLYTHGSGHALPYAQSPDGLETPVGGAGCAADELAWFDAKLKGGPDEPLDEVCFVLSDGDTVSMLEDRVLAPQPELGLAGGASPDFTTREISAGPVPNGVFAAANTSGNLPVAVPLGTVEQPGILAGLPHLTVTVASLDGVNEQLQDCSAPTVPTLRTGCDSITFVGIGIRKAGAPLPVFKLIDDQLQPLRGLGEHDVDLVGIAERLEPGDELALLLYGAHTQFFGSYSRDVTIPAVKLTGTLKLPVYAADLAGQPDPDADAQTVLPPTAASAGLATCYTHPQHELCPLKPLVELLSVNQRHVCFTEGFTHPDCPLNAVVTPLIENDPTGAAEGMAEIVSDVAGCAVQPKSPFCQFSAEDCDIDPTGQACALNDVLQAVYDLNDQLGLPVTGPEGPGETFCDLPAGDPAEGSLEWQQRDLMNIVCAVQRLTDQYTHPDFHLALTARASPRTDTYGLLEQLADPTRPRVTLGQWIPGARSTDPYRVDEDWAFAGRGRVDHISFIAESGARLVGRVFRPPSSIAPPYPLIVVTTGSIQGYQEMYNWAFEGLAEAGYMVLSYDVQGQGRSETLPHEDDASISTSMQGVPFQQAYNFVQGTRDALRWALSSAGTPYAPATPNSLGTELYNPFSAEVDRSRIGLAGHSLGASAVSQVAQEQACDPLQPRAVRNGCVSAVVGWDALSAPPSGTPIKAPGLSLTAEYFLNPTPAQSPPDAESGLGALNAYMAEGVDGMRVSQRSSTHLEWTYIPLILPASRYGERVSMHYTLAWFDRYVRDDESATARLTATHFDGSADASSIGAGTWDPVSGNNVPYRIEGDCVANRVSIYYRSAFWLEGGDRMATNLRARGCEPDEDGDGVPGAEDRCPGTPPGEPVDANGCSADQAAGDGDNDGVNNSADACPMTPPGETGDVDASGCAPSERDSDGDGVRDDEDLCPATPTGVEVGAEGCPVEEESTADYGSGILGVFAQYIARLQPVIAALLRGDAQGAGELLVAAVTELVENAAGLPDGVEPERPGATLVGLADEPDAVVQQTLSAKREVEPVVLTGERLPGWSQPAAAGAPYPYPSGATTSGELNDQAGLIPGHVRDAHNGVFLYPAGWSPGDDPVNSGGVPVDEIAAYRYEDGAFVEIPVQVDERYPYFLANANSDFSVYSGTDEELSYAWDTENWKAGDSADGCNAVAPPGTPDPVGGLDNDDEVVFMASDAGTEQAPLGTAPAGLAGADSQEIVLADPLDAAAVRYVYLFRKPGGSSFTAANGYVTYTRDANADQWIDRDFFANDDPEKLGSSNTGYGPNLSGTVCPNGVPRQSNDRFPRDGITVATDTYLWRATGRWMVRGISIDNPETPIVDYGPDLIDRWKGRAFQQSPDSTISVVGFEDEQVNWEANSALLGERCGPVRCMREVWGADSGTNVTKTETFYRDAVTYRYRVRVHPIPPDGLYTSWDYNRDVMVNPANPGAEGRYYTALRPQGVPIDGINDDIGQVDGIVPVAGQCVTLDGPQAPGPNGLCPAFFDAADPSFNLPLAFNNWEQVSGKDDSGSLVYLFQLTGPTSLANPLVVPYYRDDACLDDGTGDDPVARPFPGESYAWNGGLVPTAYDVEADRPLDHTGKTFADCIERQGAHGAHGIHYFVTHDSDNAFVEGKPITEVDGMQWQFMVPTERPTNVGDPYANVVRAPLQAVVLPRAPVGGGALGALAQFAGDLQRVIVALLADPASVPDALQLAATNLAGNLQTVLTGDGDGSLPTLAANAGENAQAGDAQGGIAGLVRDAGRVIGLAGGSTAGSNVRAGVGVVDMTPDVGYGAGQYSDTTDLPDGLAGGDIDPYLTHKKQKTSYGVQSRLTARAIVVEGNNGKRIALVKSDNYLAQDMLMRRVGQILDANGSSGVRYEDILHHVTHNHSSSYSATLAWGLVAFQDAFDPRFFEDQARRLAEAIELAAANLKPARMGATTVRHHLYKGNVVGTATADDGTPAGYPLEYGDHGVVVLRFDDVTTNEPIAVWMNWGEHPESLDGQDLHSADFLAALERFVERDTGVPVVFSQGDVGSAERSGNTQQRLRDDGSVCEGPGATPGGCPAGQGVWRDWDHNGYVQTERNVRYLADAVVAGFHEIPMLTADDPVNGKVMFSDDFPVGIKTAWTPGPLSHPYPSVSNCRTEPTLEGNTGLPVLGLPDCFRDVPVPGENPVGAQLAMIVNTMKAEGVPVPDHYDAPSFTAVEENARLMLQAVRLGDILLASCACEAQNDLILNLESRADRVQDNIYNGFDWACVAEDLGLLTPADPAYAQACGLQRDRYYDVGEFPTTVPGSLDNANLLARMRAQVHNDARGWDAPENAPFASTEPANVADIKGNFTQEEIQDFDPSVPGYTLVVGIGHAGDYNGYTVSYREYMNRDHYRKALTAYGPHTADYMVTRLVRMGAELQGGRKLPPEPHDAVGAADELRQANLSKAVGAATAAAYDAWLAALPPDVGPADVVAQPADITHFSAATFRWRGGNTQVDNPVAKVQRRVNSEWQDFADMSGEVQTRVHWPQGLPGVVGAYTGQFAWEWTANFEAYRAFPARLGSTPAGTYRFVVEGCINDSQEDLPNGLLRRLSPASTCPGGSRRYQLASNAFAVSAWPGGPVPLSYDSVFPAIFDNNNGRFCENCTFRPWATTN